MKITYETEFGFNDLKTVVAHPPHGKVTLGRLEVTRAGWTHDKRRPSQFWTFRSDPSVSHTDYYIEPFDKAYLKDAKKHIADKMQSISAGIPS